MTDSKEPEGNAKERKKRKRALRRLEALAEQVPQYFGQQYHHATKELDNAENSNSIRDREAREREEVQREQALQKRFNEILSRRFPGGASIDEV